MSSPIPPAVAAEGAPSAVTASFRFYAELNDFIAPDRRHHAFDLACAAGATVKQAIEAVGVPHTEVERIAGDEGRIVLNRDRELLKRRSITHGCYVHALKPGAQLAEILARLDLADRVRPLSRCLECNAPLTPVDKARGIDAQQALVPSPSN